MLGGGGRPKTKYDIGEGVGPKSAVKVTYWIPLSVQGLVRSKIFRGYVKVEGLEETLILTRTKSDKNWPRTGASNTTR